MLWYFMLFIVFYLQEMSPIDIVPLEENAYDLESNMDIVPNHQIYHSERTDSTIFSNMSAMPLMHQPPQRQASHQTVKKSNVSSINSSVVAFQSLISL